MNSIQRSFLVRGVKLFPWRHDKSLHVFQWSSMDGLLDLSENVRIIAINNDRPGNGEFQAFMKDIAEQSADENRVEVQVVQICNMELLSGLCVHGYENRETDELGVHSVRPARIPVSAR